MGLAIFIKAIMAIGNNISACRKINILIILLLDFNLSVMSGLLSCISEENRLGNAVSIPTSLAVAPSKSRNGVK
jgi:predicted ABC-type sugar transport system permease subunit